MIAGNEKKYKKSQKKFGNTKKGCNFVAVIKSNNIMKTTKESKVDRFIKISEFVGIAIICAFMALGVLF